ncbi:MAG: gamma-glutamylcyclotransferase [Alphaproteobacteria bacterium]|nr:gamma-glutamylcyclotransferase [Alphaproteobacteria bacterium]
MAADPPTDDKNCLHKLTRESVLSGEMRRLLEQLDPSVRVVPDAEHCASVAAILASRPDGGGDVWLFAYGSLIWNPMIHFVDKRVATVRGYHRRCCLWTHLGRGSAETPGLILGLDRGGACRGVAYRISASIAAAELELLWRREMITGSYCPRWVRIVTDKGSPGWAIAFLINRAHPRYAGLVPEDRIVESIARARGALGPCAGYLFDTAEHLEALGIRDKRLSRLRDRVAQVLERQKKSAE